MRLAIAFATICAINAILLGIPVDPPERPDAAERHASKLTWHKSAPTQAPAQATGEGPKPAPVADKQDTPKVQQPTPKVQQPTPKEGPKGLPTANDAAALAVADLRGIPDYDAKYVRYLWVPPDAANAMHAAYQAYSLVINETSTSPVIVRPVPLGVDKLMILRIDLRAYSGSDDDLANLVKVFEVLRFDGAFNFMLDKDTIRFAEQVGLKVPPLTTKIKKSRDKVIEVDPKTKGMDGGKPATKIIQETYEEEVAVNVVRIPDIDPLLYQELYERTGSEAAIVSGPYFLFRFTATIEDDGAYKDVFGGVYTQAAGIPENSKEGSDLENLFEKLVLGKAKKGLKDRDIFNLTRADKRAVLVKSDVTKHPRRIDFERQLTGGLGITQGLFVITLDLERKSIGLGQRQYLNLLDSQPDGFEAIWELANGLHGFAVGNGKGKILRQVADTIATDPTDELGNLQAMIGCKSCHDARGDHLGWIKFKDDGRKVLKELDINNDSSFRSRNAALNRTAGLFSGDPEDIMQPGRDHYSRAVFRATGPWRAKEYTEEKKVFEDSTQITRFASTKILQIRNDYIYKLVSPADVLRDLGIEPEEKAAEQLKKLLPPVAAVGVPGVEFFPEDGRIGFLKEGVSIPRTDYEFARPFIRLRVAQARQAPK